MMSNQKIREQLWGVERPNEKMVYKVQKVGKVEENKLVTMKAKVKDTRLMYTMWMV